MRRLFAKFDEHRDLWASAVRCLAHVDALLSLAEVSSRPGFSRPIFYEGATTASFIRLKNAQHPCLAQTYQGGEYIPNDAALGATPEEVMDDAPAAPNMLLLTGPNMGGKSTLLRQTCLVAILAQVGNSSVRRACYGPLISFRVLRLTAIAYITLSKPLLDRRLRFPLFFFLQVGCFVPADEAHMTPFDRIFTRVGASDRILAGQSTFFVELSETANILHHATSRSLVILDELGEYGSANSGQGLSCYIVHRIPRHELVILDISCVDSACVVSVYDTVHDLLLLRFASRVDVFCPTLVN